MGASQSDLKSIKDPGPAVTEARILKAIKSHEKTENVALINMEDASGNVTEKGFCSTLENLKIQALVHGEKKSYAWVIKKSMPRDPNRALMSMAYKADEREAIFYGTLIPH
jgi:hypothetical protein